MLGEPNLITRVLTEGGREGDVMAEADFGVVGGHKPRNMGRLRKPGKARNRFCPGTYRRNTTLPSP